MVAASALEKEERAAGPVAAAALAWLVGAFIHLFMKRYE